MFVFVGTTPFRRIALWVAMETMRLSIARISFFSCGQFFGGHAWGPNEQFDTHCTCNMILIARFQRFSALIFFEDFFL